MIANEQELQVTFNRIRSLQEQTAALRRTELDPENYRASAGAFLAEIDRMQLEIGQFLAHRPAGL
jgi:hypothetical protein